MEYVKHILHISSRPYIFGDMPRMLGMPRQTKTRTMEPHMSENDAKITSMRTTVDVTEKAKLAASLKGISMMDWVRQVVLEAAARDIEEFRRGGDPPTKPRKTKVN
jgi:hypothetical protein